MIPILVFPFSIVAPFSSDTDSVTVIESETVVIAVDSIAPDSAAMKQKAPTPKKTK